jgi:hypothetical protein
MPARLLLLVALLTSAPVAFADISIKSATLDAEYWTATGFDEGDGTLSRLTLRPAARVRLGKNWEAEGQFRLELADDQTGLGTMETYSDISRPLKLGNHGRFEIDRATLSWRKKSTILTLGKQSVAWGVMDGLQVTDRFDATRRRDAVFTEERPERIGRWGARLRGDYKGTKLDAAAFFDGTVGQAPANESAFYPQARRLRGGIPAGFPTPPLDIHRPDSPTLGLRATQNFGTSDVSALVLHGPETEPIFESATAGIVLKYPDRTLIGATWEKSDGARIWRLEAAHVPDQPVNLSPAPNLSIDTRARWLAGMAVDWKTGTGLFLNAQLGIDHIGPGAGSLVRPDTDVIATLRMQRGFRNDTVFASTELMTSLSDGDGAFRPELSWQANDQVRFSAGADLIFGRKEGLFGQFQDASRIWLKARLSV